MPENAADIVALSFLRWQADQDIERQRRYASYREYYDGEHETQLTDRQRRYLQLKYGAEFRNNYCPLVVDSLVERLSVTGFQAQGQEDVLWDWWQANRMDAVQHDVHLAAVRDGDAYILVEWDEDAGEPRFVMELAYDGSDGVKFHYSDEKRGEPLFASKRWVITDPTGDGSGYRRRLNLYLPDRIEKYVSDSREERGDWQPYTEEDGTWPLPWTRTGTEGGEPLGIPVIHVRYRAGGYNFGRSRLDDVVPLQNQLNKAVIDLVGVADHSGFQILTATGDDFASISSVGPGSLLHSQKPDARFGAIPPADLKALIEYKNDIVMDIAKVSNTPLSRLQMTGQIASEGTLKQQDAGLVAEAEIAQVDFGNAWEDALKMARKLLNVFGEESINEDEHIDTQWTPAATRDERELAETYKIWSDSFGVPDEIIWKRIGLTDDEIEAAKDSDQYQERLAMRQMGLMLDEEERQS